MSGVPGASAEPPIDVVDLPAQPLAVIRETGRFPAFRERIGPLLGEAFAYATSRPELKTTGRMIIVYHNESMKFFTPEGILIEYGTRVERAFEGNGRVVCSILPACRAVHGIHLGPYDRMGETHDAVARWAQARGHAIRGFNWELYDHPVDDPAKLRTDIYHRLT